MILYFVETEPPEQQFFEEQLSGHHLNFVPSLDAVEADAEVLSCFIYSHISAEFLDSHPALKLIATRSTGVDHIDLAACRVRNVAVCHVPQYGESTVAEHTFALILALSRRLREVMLTPARGQFSYAETRAFDLDGKTLGIVGMGNIGRRVAQLAEAFRMKIVACDVATSDAVARELHFTWVSRDELLAVADIITLHSALTPETHHFLNAKAFARCKKGALVINTARGGLIDTVAMRDALESGHLGGAGLDVLEDERVMRASAANIITSDIVKNMQGESSAAREEQRLRELREIVLGDAILSRSNVVFTPHVAFNSVEAAACLTATTLGNIQGFIAGEPRNLSA